MNFTYTLIKPPDGQWGAIQPDGSWSGLVGMLIRQEIDMGKICDTRKPASRVFLAPPEGLMKFLSSLYHA